MKEYIKIGISAVTLVILVSGFLLTLAQVRSANEIRLESNRAKIIASTEPTVLDAIRNQSNAESPSESIFLRALFANYVNVYRLSEQSLGFYGALSESYIADTARTFCWWLKHDAAKNFWELAVHAANAKNSMSRRKGGTNLSEIESEWCKGVQGRG